MNLFKKYYYRIVQLEENFFQVQFRTQFLPIWEDLNCHGSIERARLCIKTCKENDKKEKLYPRIVK